ncbi:hypothetical protein Tco_0750591 [Tanacetum coccineum]|uniref:Uncharacterized protein n=1 Tax=Tanacetum coccineum TaxID=301880 RepID=A0ABQ4Z2M2_9ASTR
MRTSKDDYLINTLRFLFVNESTQIYGKLHPETLTSPEMKESKAYQTYLGYATGDIPPKIARKFKKASPSKKDRDLVPVDEEPIKKGQRVKRPAKKSTTIPAAGIVIREAPVETKTKRKEKVDVTHGKGIELLSEVAWTKEAQMKEVRWKSLRDFHKTHPSGSGFKICDDEIEGDEDKGMDDTTIQFDVDAIVGLNDVFQADEEGVQQEGVDAKMTDAKTEKENLEIPHNQVMGVANIIVSPLDCSVSSWTVPNVCRVVHIYGCAYGVLEGSGYAGSRIDHYVFLVLSWRRIRVLSCWITVV